MMFLKAQSHVVLGFFGKKICRQKRFKNRPIWSHWLLVLQVKLIYQVDSLVERVIQMSLKASHKVIIFLLKRR